MNNRCQSDVVVRGDATNVTGSVMLTVHQVAQILNCSVRHVYRLADAGQMPRPVRLGALVRWNRTVIDAWITSGCPVPKKCAGHR